MPLLQRAEIAERIRRAFGLRAGEGAGASLSPELVPVVLVEDLTGPSIDEGYPRLCVARSVAGQSVGVFAECFLINRAQTQVDLILSEIWVRRGNTAGLITLHSGLESNLNALLDTNTTRSNLDLRVQLRPNATVNSRNQAAKSTPSNLHLTVTAAVADWVILPTQFTVPPGMWISVSPDINNEACLALFFWTERLRTTT
jgi:hypothetical protein